MRCVVVSGIKKVEGKRKPVLFVCSVAGWEILIPISIWLKDKSREQCVVLCTMWPGPH